MFWRLSVAVVAMMVPLSVAGGQPTAGSGSAATVTACPPNAALAYWRAWNGRFPAIFDNKYLEAEFRQFNDAWTPPPAIASVLEGAQGDIGALMEATKVEACDWGVPIREEGFKATLPHLAKLRTSARVLLADSRRLSAKGDVVGAAERLAALALMSRHLRSDKTVVSVRTAQSLAIDFAMKEMQRLAKAGTLPEQAKAVMIDAAQKMAGADPCGMREALAEEPIMMQVSVKRLCKGPEAGKVFLREFAPQAKEEERAKSGMEQLDEAGVHAAADRAAVFYQELLANWDMPEPVKQARAIDDQRKNGDYGPVAQLNAAEFPHLRRVVALMENNVAETLRVLKGEPAPAGAPK